MHFKTVTSKIQKIHFKTFISKIHIKIAPSKNAFQNGCFNSLVIEGIRTLLFFFTESFKKIKTQIQLLNKPKTF